MNKTGFFFNPIFLEHKTGPGHPESPQRLKHLISKLKSDPLYQKLIKIDTFPSLAPESLYSVHAQDHVSRVRSAIESGATVLDSGDTTVSAKSFAAALKAADAAVEAAVQVWQGKLQRAFVAVRPPGHHAERNEVIGFCIFNNIAVAAHHLLHLNVERIAIIDWDVHHGNGTQNCFYEDNRVLFISLHQYPHYPRTGSANETGSGEGKGYTLNFPMPAGSNAEDYLHIFKERITTELDKFVPEIILISAGFDAHSNDPLSSIDLETETFAAMTRILLESAEKHCNGKMVSILEGGYNVDAFSDSIIEHLKVLSQ